MIYAPLHHNITDNQKVFELLQRQQIAIPGFAHYDFVNLHLNYTKIEPILGDGKSSSVYDDVLEDLTELYRRRLYE